MMYRNLFGLVLLSLGFLQGTPRAFCQASWIYRDAVESPWILNGGGATFTPQVTAYVYAGTYSLKAVVPQWSQPSFHYGNWGTRLYLNFSDYAAWEFYIYVTGGDGRIYMHANNDSVSITRDPAYEFPLRPGLEPFIVQGNTWTRISVPMSAFKTNGHLFNQLNLQEGAPGGRTWYLDEIKLVGVPTSTEQQNIPLPVAFALRQNFPNPFNPLTRIQFDLPHACLVSLKVYNVLGQEVATLVAEDQEAGYKSVEFNTAGLASGVYLYILRAEEFVQAKRMVLLK